MCRFSNCDFENEIENLENRGYRILQWQSVDESQFVRLYGREYKDNLMRVLKLVSRGF